MGASYHFLARAREQLSGKGGKEFPSCLVLVPRHLGPIHSFMKMVGFTVLNDIVTSYNSKVALVAHFPGAPQRIITTSFLPHYLFPALVCQSHRIVLANGCCTRTASNRSDYRRGCNPLRDTRV